MAGEEGLIGADVFDSFWLTSIFPMANSLSQSGSHRPDDPAPGTEPSPETVTFQIVTLAPEMKSFTPVLRFGHALLINTQLNELAAKLFLIDTALATRFRPQLHERGDRRILIPT